MPTVMVNLLRVGVKVILTSATIQVEPRRRGSDVIHLTFQCGHFKVGQVT